MQVFYTCALGCKDDRATAVAAFLLHQVAEMTHCATLFSLMEKEIRTHSIKALINHSRRWAPQLYNVFPLSTPEERQLVHILEEAYLKARSEACKWQAMIYSWSVLATYLRTTRWAWAGSCSRRSVSDRTMSSTSCLICR